MKTGVLAVLAVGVLAGCASPYGSLSREVGDRMMAQRRAEIAAEPRGNYFVGRRYVVPNMRFWGYLRQPGAAWETSRIVLMDERVTRVPDRLPEEGEGLTWGYDHNYEYVVRGGYTGETWYDPNSNSQLPVFRPTGFEVKKRDGGFLYRPGEKVVRGQLPKKPR